MKTASRALTLLLLAAAVGAELPPSAYRERQQNAPEHLEIQVLSVSTRKTDEPGRVRTDVRAEAKVERVRRSASGLESGDVIRIRYDHTRHKEPIAGPSEVPILERGRRGPAFLSKDPKSRTYLPAAGGYSFRDVS